MKSEVERGPVDVDVAAARAQENNEWANKRKKGYQ